MHIIIILAAGVSIASSDILENEFGIGMEMIPDKSIVPSPSAAQDIPRRDFYQKHAPAGSLVPLPQRNVKGPVRSNSRFKSSSGPRGSTLPSRTFRSSPKAPSRFNR